MQNITEAVADFLDQQDKLIEKDTRNCNKDNKHNKHNKEIINLKEPGMHPVLDKQLSVNEVAPLSVGSLASPNDVAVALPPVKDRPAKKQQGMDLVNISKKWRTIKLDLFNNTRDPNKPYDYTLKINIYLYQQCKENNWDTKNPVNLSAKFNDTSLDSFNIGIVKSNPHYKEARQFRDDIYVDANQLGIEHLSLNKFYIPTKDKKLKNKFLNNFSGLLIRDSHTHQVVIFKEQERYQYELSNLNLTLKQRKARMIGSCVVRAEDSLQTPQQDAADFL